MGEARRPEGEAGCHGRETGGRVQEARGRRADSPGPSAARATGRNMARADWRSHLVSDPTRDDEPGRRIAAKGRGAQAGGYCAAARGGTRQAGGAKAGRRAIALVSELPAQAGRHTSRASSTTRRSFASCCAKLRPVPFWWLAKPHWGETHKLSSGTYFDALLILLIKKPLSSRAGVFVETNPSTTFFPLGTKRSGSKPPARSVSYSRK